MYFNILISTIGYYSLNFIRKYTTFSYPAYLQNQIPLLPMQSVWRSWFLNHFPMASFSTMFSMIVFTMISTMSTWFVFIHTLLVSEVSLHHFSITSQWPLFCGPTRRMRPVACRLCKCFAIPLSAISSSFAMAREVI